METSGNKAGVLARKKGAAPGALTRGQHASLVPRPNGGSPTERGQGSGPGNQRLVSHQRPEGTAFFILRKRTWRLGGKTPLPGHAAHPAPPSRGLIRSSRGRTQQPEERAGAEAASCDQPTWRGKCLHHAASVMTGFPSRNFPEREQPGRPASAAGSVNPRPSGPPAAVETSHGQLGARRALRRRKASPLGTLRCELPAGNGSCCKEEVPRTVGKLPPLQ